MPVEGEVENEGIGGAGTDIGWGNPCALHGKTGSLAQHYQTFDTSRVL